MPASQPGFAQGTPPAATIARSIVLHALLLGIAADALLRGGPVGLGLPLWVALLAAATTALARRSGRILPAETRAWLLVAVLFSVGLAWRDSGMLQFFDFVATVGALVMAGIALHDRESALWAERGRDTLLAGVRLVRDVAVGVLPLVLRELAAPERRARSHRGIWPALRALLIAAVLFVAFGTLLRDADPVFASVVSLPEIDGALVLSHIFVTGFFGWIVAGWARGSLVAAREPVSRSGPPFELGMLDVTAALGTLIALFAAFVVVQLGWFFGGEAFLRARTGLTAAAYARGGFFQLLWVALLVVPLLLATRATLGRGQALARRHTMLSLPLLLLVGAIMLSAATRMRLYVHYYGLTTGRLYPLVFMGWLAFVLVWLALTLLRDRGRLFVAGSVVSAACVLATLNVAAPDAIVARVNIARAHDSGAPAGASPSLDLQHLALLSGEAVDLAVQQTFAPAAPIAEPAAAPARAPRGGARGGAVGGGVRRGGFTVGTVGASVASGRRADRDRRLADMERRRGECATPSRGARAGATRAATHRLSQAGASAIVPELQLHAEILALEQGDRLLQLVA